MPVQLNHHPGDRDFSVTATDLPLNPAALPAALPGTRGPRPVVAVFGHASRIAGLDQHLPTGWSIRRPSGSDDVAPGELVLIAGATVAAVTLARAALPGRTQIVAVVDDLAPPEVVTGVLTAGADACVRGCQPAILAGHLVACRRRVLADRWSRLNEQDRR